MFSAPRRRLGGDKTVAQTVRKPAYKETTRAPCGEYKILHMRMRYKCIVLLSGRNFVSDICKRLFLARSKIKCPSPFFFILNLEVAQCADDGVCRTINAYDLAALLASGAGRLSAVFKFLF